MSAQPYDAVLLDLDGVIYTGRQAVPGAAEALNGWARRGVPYAFLTNNAARDVREIAQTISSFGVDARPEHVRTSAQACAAALREELPGGAAVLTIGSEFLRECLHEEGFTVVNPADSAWLRENVPAAVVQGFNAETTWKDIAAAITAVRSGALYRPTNPDRSIPTNRGIQPGNGTFVDIVTDFTGEQPVYAGKPEPVMLRQATERLGAANPVMVGDQLDTDIAAANAAGIDGLLVLTGVSTIAQALAAPSVTRPVRIIATLAEVDREMPPVEVGHSYASCGQARVEIADGAVAHTGPADLAVHAALLFAQTHDQPLDAGTLPEALL